MFWAPHASMFLVGKCPNFSVSLYWKEITYFLNWPFLLDVSCALHHMIHTHCATGANLCEWHPRVPFFLTSDGVYFIECTLHDCVLLYSTYPYRAEVTVVPVIRSASIDLGWGKLHSLSSWSLPGGRPHSVRTSVGPCCRNTWKGHLRTPPSVVENLAGSTSQFNISLRPILLPFLHGC